MCGICHNAYRNILLFDKIWLCYEYYLHRWFVFVTFYNRKQCALFAQYYICSTYTYIVMDSSSIFQHIATGDATPSPTTDVTDYSDVDGHFRDNKLGVALETLIKKYKLEFATPKAPAKEESSYTGVIVGIIVALVVIALIVTGVVCYRKGNCPYRYRFWSTLSEPVVSA